MYGGKIDRVIHGYSFHNQTDNSVCVCVGGGGCSDRHTGARGTFFWDEKIKTESITPTVHTAWQRLIFCWSKWNMHSFLPPPPKKTQHIVVVEPTTAKLLDCVSGGWEYSRLQPSDWNPKLGIISIPGCRCLMSSGRRLHGRTGAEKRKDKRLQGTIAPDATFKSAAAPKTPRQKRACGATDVELGFKIFFLKKGKSTANTALYSVNRASMARLSVALPTEQESVDLEL